MRKTSLILLITVLTIGLTACGGNKKKAAPVAQANTQAVDDITRPPQVNKNSGPIEAESNPDETISFDEWRRRRQAEAEANDQ